MTFLIYYFTIIIMFIVIYISRGIAKNKERSKNGERSSAPKETGCYPKSFIICSIRYRKNREALGCRFVLCPKVFRG